MLRTADIRNTGILAANTQRQLLTGDNREEEDEDIYLAQTV